MVVADGSNWQIVLGISQRPYFVKIRHDSNNLNMYSRSAAESQKVYPVLEDATLCCFDSQCNAVWAARASNILD